MNHFQEAGTSEQIGSGAGWLTLVPIRLVHPPLADGPDVFEQEVGSHGRS
jgi:hypothetical protein